MDGLHRVSHQAKVWYNLDEYSKMFNLQGGKCAICGHEPQGSQKLDVDHSHTSGAVRGLLCNNCNKALGLVHDSVEVLENAIKYLKTTIYPGV